MQKAKCKRQRIEFRKGFTLLETIVALTVLLAAIAGPVSLVTRGLFSSSFSKNRLIAAHLAQEGIELIRLIREQNVMCIVKGAASMKWDTDFDGTGSLRGAGPKTIDATDVFTTSCAPGVTIHNPRRGGNCDTTTLRIDSSSGYNHVTGATTIFTRCVDVIQPSANEGTIPKQDIMDVISKVQWNEKGTTRTVELKEKFYNWR